MMAHTNILGNLAPSLAQRILPDSIYSIILFQRRIGHVPNIINPKTFNEKVLYKMLFDRREILNVFCDKYRVRDYVAEKLATERYLARLYGVYERPEEIRLSDLAEEFMLKP